MNKMFRILEIIWLVMAGIGIVMCAYFIVIHDNQGAIYFLIFTFISGIIYSIRKRQRKKFEAVQKSKEKKINRA